MRVEGSRRLSALAVALSWLEYVWWFTCIRSARRLQLISMLLPSKQRSEAPARRDFALASPQPPSLSLLLQVAPAGSAALPSMLYAATAPTLARAQLSELIQQIISSNFSFTAINWLNFCGHGNTGAVWGRTDI